MSFDWRGYLRFAEFLHEFPEDLDSVDKDLVSEACYRSVASRAYYAAFHVLLNYGINNGYDQKYDGRDHQGLEDHLEAIHLDNKEWLSIREDLANLKRNRIRADYRSEIPKEQKSFAFYSILYARGIFKRFDALMSN